MRARSNSCRRRSASSVRRSVTRRSASEWPRCTGVRIRCSTPPDSPDSSVRPTTQRWRMCGRSETMSTRSPRIGAAVSKRHRRLRPCPPSLPRHHPRRSKLFRFLSTRWAKRRLPRGRTVSVLACDSVAARVRRSEAVTFPSSALSRSTFRPRWQPRWRRRQGMSPNQPRKSRVPAPARGALLESGPPQRLPPPRHPPTMRRLRPSDRDLGRARRRQSER